MAKVRAPNASCRIEAYVAVGPTEDPEKVRRALSNVIPGSDYEYGEGSIKATSRDLEALERIQETIKNRKVTKVYRRQLGYNTKGDSTWFYLNKQAAFVNVVAICEEAGESPLGPIKVTLRSKNLEKIVDWLLDSTS